MATYGYKIGTSVATLTNLESLSTPVRPPKYTFRPCAEVRKLVSGLARGVGWPVATWRFSQITTRERDMLRTFCGGTSARVYITTRTNDSADGYKTFLATMIWPTQNEDYEAHYRKEFVVEFIALEEVTP